MLSSRCSTKRGAACFDPAPCPIQRGKPTRTRAAVGCGFPAEPAGLPPVSDRVSRARAVMRSSCNPFGRGLTMNALRKLLALGQSCWIDDLSRHMIRSGELARLAEEGVRGGPAQPGPLQK